MHRTAKMVQQLAAEGKTYREIADEVGVSRQRVYQIAKQMNLSVRRSINNNISEAFRRQKFVPKVITGGIQQEVNATTAGTIAELLAAADLMARGWQVFLPILPSRGHDIIAMKEGRLVTVEVRSARRNADGHLIFGRSSSDNSDVYALVVTGEPVAYRPDIEATQIG